MAQNASGLDSLNWSRLKKQNDPSRPPQNSIDHYYFEVPPMTFVFFLLFVPPDMNVGSCKYKEYAGGIQKKRGNRERERGSYNISGTIDVPFRHAAGTR